MAAPIIPGLSDPELEAILEAGRTAGAQAATFISLRLPLEVSALFQDWLATHYPDRAAKVMARVRELHGGKDYDPEWGKRFRGQGLWADLMARRFQVAVARLGLDAVLPPLRCDLFRPPPRSGDQLVASVSQAKFLGRNLQKSSKIFGLIPAARAVRVWDRPKCRRCRPRPTRTRPACRECRPRSGAVRADGFPARGAWPSDDRASCRNSRR